MGPSRYGAWSAGNQCRCGHLATDHEQNTYSVGACEFFALGEHAGLNGKGLPHCQKFLARNDSDEFRIELWTIHNRHSATVAERDLARLRAALQRAPSGSVRERHRLALHDLERRVRAA